MRRRTRKKILSILAIIGIIVAAYLGYIYYYDAHEVCDINEQFNCSTVHDSDYATIFGVSVALIGIIGYVAILLGLYYLPWSVKWMALFGSLFSLRLTWAEIFIINKYCIFCLISQLIIILIFVYSVEWKKVWKKLF